MFRNGNVIYVKKKNHILRLPPNYKIMQNNKKKFKCPQRLFKNGNKLK